MCQAGMAQICKSLREPLGSQHTFLGNASSRVQALPQNGHSYRSSGHKGEDNCDEENAKEYGQV